jgi:hypothetical protein
MQTKLFILQEVEKKTSNTKLIGVFNFIEDAIEQTAKTNPEFQHIKFEIYESILGSGVSNLCKTISCTVPSDVLYF